MGIKLVVEVMDHAPEDLTPAERLVLVVIAENVRDGDPKRETWPGFNAAVLAKRAGLTGDGSLKRALQRLAKRGMEVRVPIATGKDGRELYAVPGQQCRYRLPVFKGGLTVPPSDDEGGTTVPAGGTRVPPKGGPESRQAGPQSPPTPHPSDSPHSSLSVPERIVRAAAVVAPEEEREFIDWITSKHQPRGPAWWRTVADNGDLPDLAAAWRAERPAAQPEPAVPPWCGKCDGEPVAERWVMGDDDRWHRCPACNPYTNPQAA